MSIIICGELHKDITTVSCNSSVLLSRNWFDEEPRSFPWLVVNNNFGRNRKRGRCDDGWFSPSLLSIGSPVKAGSANDSWGWINYRGSAAATWKLRQPMIRRASESILSIDSSNASISLFVVSCKNNDINALVSNYYYTKINIENLIDTSWCIHWHHTE